MLGLTPRETMVVYISRYNDELCLSINQYNNIVLLYLGVSYFLQLELYSLLRVQ